MTRACPRETCTQCYVKKTELAVSCIPDKRSPLNAMKSNAR